VCATPTCSDGVKNGSETDIDCGGAACSKCGSGKSCGVAGDCSSGVCTAGQCAAPTCTDTVKNQGESDVDCGGSTSCSRCGPGKTCTGGADCTSTLCAGGLCTTPSCGDGAKNGSETDVDCGGSCTKCGTGKLCGQPSDCQSGVCNVTCQAPTCFDGIKNGSETDVDCGGSCANKCGIGKLCGVNADCQSGVCTGGVCQNVGCNDNVKNGSETDIDCGGGTCGPCANGMNCLSGTDCQSLVCGGSPLRCLTPTCSDNVQNGSETDKDCGGPGGCPRCLTAQKCNASSDCQSGVCNAGLCAAPSCSDGVKNQGESDIDCGGASPCNRCGAGKACGNASDCLDGVCAGGVCQAPTCSDTVRNQGESDIDCGGNTTCLRCAPGQSCTAGSDCTSTLCSVTGSCTAPSCSDGAKNQGESDIDCGGSTPCARCGPGKTCTASTDCLSNLCSGSQCTAPSCYDGIQNQNESDIDCGGVCFPCGPGRKCNTNADCNQVACAFTAGVKICQWPSCSDGILNGEETYTDCGGPDCPQCKPGETCKRDADCSCDRCVDEKCGEPICGDGIVCGSEFCDDGFTDPCGSCSEKCDGPGSGSSHPSCRCADQSVEQTFWYGGMVGCSGKVGFVARDNLCGVGYTSCTAQQYVSNRAGSVPTNNYWTADPLKRKAGDSTNNCSVGLSGVHTVGCSAGHMLVCRSGQPDPQGNTCEMTGCGLNNNTPNQYFGGCSTNGQAGTMCCPLIACAGGTNDQQFSASMVGCAGSVTWDKREYLCAGAWKPCTAKQYVLRRNSVIPDLNYWTDDDLKYEGSSGACWVTKSEKGESCPGEPMRVCTGVQPDGKGNKCNMVGCGYESASPNQYFGGCSGNDTAGTLCCLSL
jgi:hypothetical protein